MKIGHGYDVHQLVENRPLILGGVSLPHSKGLLGHSDADVLTHAIMDAILGALARGSIGDHFPDSDPKYKDISSIDLLKHVSLLMRDQGFAISHIDTTLIAQAPKIAPYVSEIRQSLATAMAIDISSLSVKATTSETLGFEGREEGISAHAVVLLYPTT